MAINSVTSILPDPEYVRALERELEQLKARIARVETQLRGGVK